MSRKRTGGVIVPFYWPVGILVYRQWSGQNLFLDLPDTRNVSDWLPWSMSLRMWLPALKCPGWFACPIWLDEKKLYYEVHTSLLWYIFSSFFLSVSAMYPNIQLAYAVAGPKLNSPCLLNLADATATQLCFPLRFNYRNEQSYPCYPRTLRWDCSKLCKKKKKRIISGFIHCEIIE